MNLRTYQSDAVAWVGGRRMSCIVAPAGAGKTVIAAAIVERFGLMFGRCAWLANTRDQCDQAKVALTQIALPLGNEVEVGCYGSFSTLVGFDLVILDECFPAGTLVDGVPIEQIKAGSMVWSMNAQGVLEPRKVLEVFKHTTSSPLVTVHAGGHRVTCTPGHPFFTANRGWVTAACLTSLDVVLILASYDNMLPMRNDHKPRKCLPVDTACRQTWEEGLLRQNLLNGLPSGSLFSNDGRNESQVCLRKNDQSQSNASPDKQRENEKHAEGDWALPKDSRRKRKRADESSVDFVELAWSRSVDNGVHCSHEEGHSRRSESLQNRLSDARLQTGHRDRRNVALGFACSRTGREKGSCSYFARVARVEVHERSSDEQSTRSDGKDTVVYNLSVEGNQNYFANGFLVHNCHHLPSRTVYLLIQTLEPHARLVGFTATPKHSNPERNEIMRQVFSDGFHVIQKADVMQAGGLVAGRLQVLKTSEPGAFDDQIEAEVKRKMGGRFYGSMKDERERQLRNQVTHDILRANHQRNALIVATADAHLASGAKVLVLVGTVEHAELLASAINGAAACFSKMGMKRRRETIGAFKDTESAVRCLVATSLADEGLDCPVASVVIMACGGREFGRVIQRVGRVMRPHADKRSGLIIELEDAGARTAYNQHKSRLKVYRTEGYT